MRKYGFSLIELIIAIALLAIIMSATTTLFIVGVKNYESESLRNKMQKEINFTADDIGTQIKQAAAASETYDVYTRAPDLLLLDLPAINDEENFIYSGQNLLVDHYIYYLDGATLYKKVVPDNESTREPKNDPVLEDVSRFECSYSPTSNTELVTCIIETSRTVNKATFTFNATKTARLRNHR